MSTASEINIRHTHNARAFSREKMRRVSAPGRLGCIVRGFYARASMRGPRCESVDAMASMRGPICPLEQGHIFGVHGFFIVLARLRYAILTSLPHNWRTVLCRNQVIISCNRLSRNARSGALPHRSRARE